jgi:hypothetical protein
LDRDDNLDPQTFAGAGRSRVAVKLYARGCRAVSSVLVVAVAVHGPSTGDWLSSFILVMLGIPMGLGT